MHVAVVLAVASGSNASTTHRTRPARYWPPQCQALMGGGGKACGGLSLNCSFYYNNDNTSSILVWSLLEAIVVP